MLKNNFVSEIKNLRDEVKPRPEWVNSSRALLLNQINSQQQYQPARIGLDGYFKLFNQIFRQHLLEPAVVMILVLIFSLASSLTINAAFYSLPGSTLYPVKIALEKTQLALVSDEKQKVELKIEFAQKRVAELDKIAELGDISQTEKNQQIQVALKDFKDNVTAVSNHLSQLRKSINQINESDGDISDQDKEQTLKMALSVSSKTEELAKTLSQKIVDLPDTDKTEMEKIIASAVQTAQQTSLSAKELLGGNSTSTDEITNDDQKTDGKVQGVDSEDQIIIDSGDKVIENTTTDSVKVKSGSDSLDTAD